MARAAVTAVTAAAGFAGAFVADHAAHNQRDYKRDHEDQGDIDKVCS